MLLFVLVSFQASQTYKRITRTIVLNKLSFFFFFITTWQMFRHARAVILFLKKLEKNWWQIHLSSILVQLVLLIISRFKLFDIFSNDSHLHVHLLLFILCTYTLFHPVIMSAIRAPCITSNHCWILAPNSRNNLIG